MSDICPHCEDPLDEFPHTIEAPDFTYQGERLSLGGKHFRPERVALLLRCIWIHGFIAGKDDEDWRPISDPPPLNEEGFAHVLVWPRAINPSGIYEPGSKHSYYDENGWWPKGTTHWMPLPEGPSDE